MVLQSYAIRMNVLLLKEHEQTSKLSSMQTINVKMHAR